MTFGFYTLGCKVNQYETQAMEQVLRQRGHTVGDFEGQCDAYIVNTCSVTAVADQEKPGGDPPVPPGTIRKPCWPCAAAIPSMIRRRWRRWGWTW